MTYARIAGTGSYLPERVVTNHDLEKTVDTSHAWIVERTGISERRIAAEGEFTSDLAHRAAERALDAAGLSASDVDLIIVATTTPDQTFPSTACRLQALLGANGCIAFDMQAACSGFVFALDVAQKYLCSGAVRNALVVGAETMSRLIDWNDRATCVLFGDGAGAVVLRGDVETGILNSRLHADGEHIAMLEVPGGVSRGFHAPGSASIHMQGNEVYRFAVTHLAGIIGEVLEGTGFTPADLDWVVPHQANIRIISAAARRLGLPMERVVTTVDRHGNTSAASIPLALDCAVRDGRIKRGQLLVFEALGAGFTWGATLLRM